MTFLSPSSSWLLKIPLNSRSTLFQMAHIQLSLKFEVRIVSLPSRNLTRNVSADHHFLSGNLNLSGSFLWLIRSLINKP